MQNWGLVLLVLGAGGDVACSSGRVGGQSGTEGGPDVPWHCGLGLDDSRPVGLDEQTPLGTARELFGSVAGPETANLRWWSGQGSSHFETTVTISVGGEPGTATYSWSVNESAPAGSPDIAPPLEQKLEVEGGILHFETADGVFDEDMPGVVSNTVCLSHAVNERTFDAVPRASLAGTYDSADLAGRYESPEFKLSTWLLPASGSLVVREASGASGGGGDSQELIAVWSTEIGGMQQTGGRGQTGGSTQSTAGAAASAVGAGGTPGRSENMD